MVASFSSTTMSNPSSRSTLAVTRPAMPAPITQTRCVGELAMPIRLDPCDLTMMAWWYPGTPQYASTTCTPCAVEAAIVGFLGVSTAHANAPAARPHIIVFGNHKGGTGKSTVAMHVIVALLKEGKRVASFDLDWKQQTLTRYIDNRRE